MYYANQTHPKIKLTGKRSNRRRWRCAHIIIWLALAGPLFSPLARATCQEGCLSDINTVFGEDALLNNAGVANTAIGADALFNNTSGFSNTATGANALFSNTTGPANTATGTQALFHNTISNDNTATGANALFSNTTGNNNTANGESALQNNVTGSNNTADGNDALQNNTGSNNIAVGSQAGINLTTGSDNIEIGAPGTAGDFKTIRLGRSGLQAKTFIAGISGATIPTGVAVIVDTKGHLGTVTSSARYKDNIQPMAKSSEAILSLQPVTFRYKEELDPEAIPQFGLVAEDVAKIDPDLVARDEKGKPYTVRYEAVNAMLLNEFLKEHKKVEEQASEIADLKSALKEVNARLTAKGL
jgi:hypothetical protein